MSSPIRVGFIGLSQASGLVVPGAWGANAHLPYLLASPKYQVVAIANSSVESAQASIDFYQLGAEVKAYGSPEDIANDPNVDLIVVNVRIGKHYYLTKPALLAGKDVFEEWPLGATLAESEELSKLAKEKGVKVIMGAQARASPLVLKLKELVHGGKIGKVTSSSVSATFLQVPIGTWMAGAEYYLDINSGGNMYYVWFGHLLESFVSTLGTFATLTSTLKTEYPRTNIFNDKGELVAENYPKTTPDHLSVQGTLASGALASLFYRTVPSPTLDGVGLRWNITGTDGEIEITVPQGPWQISYPGTVMKARLGKGAEVEVIDFEKELTAGEGNEVRERSGEAINTARLYEAFAAGDKEKFVDFEGAVEIHRLLERIREAAKF